VDGHRPSQDEMMRLASIDIGTNTILMLVADAGTDGSLSIVKEEHVIARLGKGVDEHGTIQEETFHRVRDILARLQETAFSLGIQQLAVCGTSALRDALNRQEFISFIKKHLSIDIKILSGQEEAELTYLGAVSEYLEGSPSGKFAVLDIGGGSTELIVGTGSDISSAISRDIGSVRITERILKTSPPDTAALENAVKFIQNHLQHLSPLSSGTTLIGVAGTLTTLAALDRQLQNFDRALIHRHVLTETVIEEIFRKLKHLTLDEIKAFPQIHPERADILLAGILILLETLRTIHVQKITVSVRGLRYGILLRTALELQ
jgi:exopolyphosphatase / guanosine-5'-triphosphate,3'-diphosphate pyrophosphatase